MAWDLLSGRSASRRVQRASNVSPTGARNALPIRVEPSRLAQIRAPALLDETDAHPGIASADARRAGQCQARDTARDGGMLARVPSTGLVLTGIPDDQVALADTCVEISMIGQGASLNVAVAGSLVRYRLAGMC
jgi:hypothetical protein